MSKLLPEGFGATRAEQALTVTAALVTVLCLAVAVGFVITGFMVGSAEFVAAGVAVVVAAVTAAMFG